MGAEYRKQVANLAQVLNREENRGEAADILRSLVDRIELRPNQQGRLEIDLYGDLAGILTLAGKKARPLDETDLSVQQLRWLRGLATIVVCTLTTQSFERQCNMHTSAFSPSERTEPAHASSLGGSNTASQVQQTEAGVLPSSVIRLRCYSRSIRLGFQKKL